MPSLTDRHSLTVRPADALCMLPEWTLCCALGHLVSGLLFVGELYRIGSFRSKSQLVGEIVKER
jgi:hypothetical protein